MKLLVRGLVILLLAEYKYKQKFEHVFQLFSCGLIFINEKGTILEVNSHIEKIFQINRDELLTMNALQLFEIFLATEENKKVFMEELFQNGYAELFSEVRTFLGEYKYIHLIVSKQNDTNIYLTEIYDESEKMNMKRRLDHTETLSTLGQLAASIAHEIRNPITSLKGFTQLLLKTATEDSKRYLNVIDDEIQRMEEILTEFLQISKPVNTEYTYIEVQQLMTEVVNFMAPQALMQVIDIVILLEINNGSKIFGNRNLLKQVFINSIKNAIESMPDGGKIHIYIKYDGNNSISVEIHDQGQGIAGKDLDKIFDPFFTTKHTGTGLGLSHVSKVIEAHGGTIEVSSKVGEGTTFKFILPIHIGS